MKCPFCKNQNTTETGKIPRGNMNFIKNDDKEIEIMKGWLYEITCNDCKMSAFVDKEVYIRTIGR